MTGTRLLWHLARFDGSRLRWWWVAILAALVFAIAQAAGMSRVGERDLPAFVAPVLLQLMVVVFAIELSQEDSPYDRHSFLKAKPIAPVVIGLSKLAPIMVLVLLAGAAAVASTATIGLGVGESLALLPRPLVSFAFTMVLGLCAGMSTRTVPAAILLILAILPLIFIIGQLLEPLLPAQATLLPGQGPWVASAVTVLCAGFLLYVYARPPRRAIAKLTIVAFGYLGVASSCSVAPETVTRATSATTAALPALAESLVFDSLPTNPFGEPVLHFTIASRRADRRYEVRDIQLTLHGEPSSAAPTPRRAVTRSPRSTLFDADTTAFPVADDISWGPRISGVPSRPTRGSLFEGIGTNGEFAQVDSVSVRARLVRLRAERLTERPFVPGVLHWGGGEQLTIERQENRAVIVWRTMRESNSRDDWNNRANGQHDIDRRYAFVVTDSMNHRVYRVEARSYAASSEPITLMMLNRQIGRIYPEPAEDFARLSANPRGVSIAVYRWVEEGDRTINTSWAVSAWPAVRPARPNSVGLTPVIK